MVSVYQYITVAELEAYTGIDYSVIDAGYTNTVIEGHITIAERSVNSICIEAPSSATDGVIVATLVLSERLMRNIMFIDGYAEESKESIVAFFDNLISIILAKDVYSPAGSVPMQGIDR